MSDFKHFTEDFGGFLPPQMSPNSTVNFENYHLSHNRFNRDYGCETTAVVLKQRVFLILHGNHRNELLAAATNNGLEGCVEYFIQHKDKAHSCSEHNYLNGTKPDIFELLPTALELVNARLLFKL